jgi:uncharacterized protein (TIGR03437 family)
MVPESKIPVFVIVLLLGLVAETSLAQTFTTVVKFGSVNGILPNLNAPLIQGGDGFLYGTTTGDPSVISSFSGGSVFRISLAGGVSTVFSFSYPVDYIYDPAGPEGGVIQGSDGNFYGTTVSGGTGLDSDGTIFKVSQGGMETIVCNFPDVGDHSFDPAGGLVQGSDGNFYGTTESVPLGYDQGTVFKCTPGGQLTAILIGEFGPAGRLISANDGNLYGVTVDGGTNGHGSVFKIVPGGSVSTIYSFGGTSSDGGSPGFWLAQGSDGNLYGVSTSGGAHSRGTVFKLTLGGTLTTIYSFANSDGGTPNAGLVQANDGNLYGTLATNEATGAGSIFRVTPSGAFTTMYSFTKATGGVSGSGLMQASDGKLYGTGTTSADGIYYYGMVYSLTIPAAPPSPPSILTGGIVPVYSSSTTIQPGSWVSIYGSNLAGATAIWNGDFPQSLGGTSVTIDGKAAYLWVVSPGQINLQAPADTVTGTVPVVVATGAGSVTSSVTLAQFAPSFLLLDARHVTGIILRSNGSGAYGGGAYDILGPTGSSLGYPTVAAKAGDSVVLFGVGFGPTNPTVPVGQSFTGSAPTTHSVTLKINNTTVIPSFAGLSSAGLYQINLVLPVGLGSGDVTMVASVNGVSTQGNVVMSLQ